MATGDAYNIFDELENWSKNLEVWQQAALLTLLTKGEIADDVFETIYQEFTIDRGLASASAERPDYSFQSRAVPQNREETKPVKLKSIRNVRGVNALTEGQELTFGENLTVIYGPNGSGKSGYARLLKSACFTRSKEKDIHGNVHLPPDKRPRPLAEFVLDSGSVEKYEKGQPCGDLLDNFAVFDSSCVRVYTDEKNEFNVSPYGFDVFPGLVKATEQVRSQLREEVEKRRPDLVSLRIGGSNSQVAQLLATLHANTDLKELQRLSIFGEAEQKQLENAQRRLEELIKQDPATLIKQKQRQTADLGTLAKRLNAIKEKLSESSAKAIEKDLKDFQELHELAKANSAVQFGGEPIQPIGTAAWMALIKAAMAYNQEAYPGATFPPSAEDARCVLCHQSLNNENARDRLSRFYKFISSDTERKLKIISERLEGGGQDLKKLDLGFVALDSSICRTLEDLDKRLLNTVNALVADAAKRRDWVVACIDKRQYSELRLLSFEVLDEIEKLENRLAVEIEELKKKSVTALKTQLTTEIQLLKDREYLNEHYSKVETAVVNLRWIEKAEQEAKSLNTKGITDKQKSLTKELVGKGFIDGFTQECAGFNFNLPIKIRVSGVSGTTQRKMEVGTQGVDAPDPSGVLSEGEQTAVALADFLTEVRLGQRPLGIIFDDPVNSMDHMRKERIAHRLVREAKERQVIVFTHDIVFTSHLAHSAELEQVKFAGRTVSLGYEDRIPGYIGHSVFPNSYYEGKGAEDAQTMVNEAKGLTGKRAAEKLQLGCGMLRTAYEDFVQRHVFNDTINRWREELKPFALANIYYDEDLVSQISEQMGRLSRHIEAHSHSPEYAEEPLTPQLLKEFISKYSEVTKEYKKRAGDFRQQKSKAKKIYG